MGNIFNYTEGTCPITLCSLINEDGSSFISNDLTISGAKKFGIISASTNIVGGFSHTIKI